MPFQPGQSGNPDGRKLGSKNKRTVARQLLESNQDALMQKAIDMALDGDTASLRLCIERLEPSLKSVELSGEVNGIIRPHIPGSD